MRASQCGVGGWVSKWAGGVAERMGGLNGGFNQVGVQVCGRVSRQRCRQAGREALKYANKQKGRWVGKKLGAPGLRAVLTCIDTRLQWRASSKVAAGRDGFLDRVDKAGAFQVQLETHVGCQEVLGSPHAAVDRFEPVAQTHCATRAC